MCTICAAFRPTDPECVYAFLNGDKAVPPSGTELSYEFAVLTDADFAGFALSGTNALDNEGTDAANGQNTVYSLNVSTTPSTFDGTIAFNGDRDWLEVELIAGEFVAFEVSGRGSNPLNDSFLRLRDENGNVIKLNDDAGSGYQAAIFYQAEYTGTYYIDVGSYVSPTSGSEFGTGEYTLRVSEFVPERQVASHDQLADYLTDGYWANQGGPWGFFDNSTTIIKADIDGLSADGQRLAKWAMQSFEMFLDIEFDIVSGDADIVFDDEDLDSAYASPEISTSWPFQIDYIEVNVGLGWLGTYGTEINEYSFQTYIHEIGHALGLGHQGSYNGSATFETDISGASNTNTYLNDSTLNSIMSYMSPSKNPFYGSETGSIVTPMLVDIIALQNIFGTPSSNETPTAGNSVWGKGHTFANAFSSSDIGAGEVSYLAALFDFAETGSDPNGWFSDSHIAFTIYDVSGHDLIDFSFDTKNQIVSLKAETLSTVFNPYQAGRNDNMWIARGTQIEDYYAGSGNDSIEGNNVANQIKGNAGNDTLIGGGGADTLVGGGGNDSLEAGPDAATLRGEGGEDTMLGGNGADDLSGSSGDDSLSGGAGADTIRGQGDGDSIDGGDGSDVITGGAGSDSIDGGAGDDDIIGQGQDDTINGEAGNDTVLGGSGNDLINGGEDNDDLSGSGNNDTLNGDGGNDLLSGAAGLDVLNGGSGDDTLNGGTGADTLDGGAGNDRMNGGGADGVRDVFVFGLGYEADRINAFDQLGTDQLRLDDALWLDTHPGGLTEQQVIDTFGTLNSTGTILTLDFGGGDVLEVQNGAGIDQATLGADVFIF